MKKLILPFCIIFFTYHNSFSQGTWTWVSGDTSSDNIVYGTLGVPDPNCHPAGLYEAPCWTDKQGDFWLYDSSLWKFDPLISEWTEMRKEGWDPVYGVKGTSASTNTPGARGQGVLTWTDTTGNLWLFGGLSFAGSNYPNYADLWKFSIASNQWTWISGTSRLNDPGNYGTKGVPSVNNYPGARCETVASWTDDSTNTLWLFGGQSDTNATLQTYNDVWKYSIANNEWTWENGSTAFGLPPVYGTVKIPGPSNTPGGRDVYCKWKDLSGNFWLFGGGTFFSPHYNDVWKYNRQTNMWTCMVASQGGTSSNYTDTCSFSPSNYPGTDYEDRGCWTDACGKFWTLSTTGDLWQFDPISAEWKLVHPNKNRYFGTKGVASTLVWPYCGTGAPNWTDKNGNFWFLETYFYSALMKYTPNASCGGCINVNNKAKAGFSSTSTIICSGHCINFSNQSTNATTYEWSFPGGSPASSTLQNPPEICYQQSGNFAVQLIASNGSNSDTLLMNNYITVNPSPVAGNVTFHPDTLCQGTSAKLTDAGSEGSLQWQSSVNGNVFSDIPAATSSVYTTPSSLNQTTYYRLISKSNNCGSDTSNTSMVHVVAGPTTNFSFIINKYQVIFDSAGTSQDVTHYDWNFGDSTTSNSINPIHNYNRADTFYVCLTVYNNSNCSFTYCKYIDLLNTGISTISADNFIHLYPNPANNTVNLIVNGLNGNNLFKIYNVLGQEVWCQSINLNQLQTISIDLKNFVQGVYFIDLYSSDRNFVLKFVKE